MSVAQSSGVMRELRRLMPQALLSVLGETPWHSITFAGTQLRLSADFAGKHHRQAATDLVRFLPEHQFTLVNGLVADIAVTDCICGVSNSSVAIDVLLLED